MLANRELPSYESYEGFCQIENGVGMLAKFEREMTEILPMLPPWILDRKVSIACGVSVAPFMKKLCGILKEKYYNLDVYIYPIHNQMCIRDSSKASRFSVSAIIPTPPK